MKDTAAGVAVETQLVTGTDEGHLVVVGQIRCSQMATLLFSVLLQTLYHHIQYKLKKLINIHKIFSLPEAKMTMRRDDSRDLIALIMPIQR